MIRRELRDLVRLYGRSWWRLGLVVLLTGLGLGLATWLGSLAFRQLPHLFPSIMVHGRLTTSGMIAVTAVATGFLALVGAPLAFGGMGAAAGVTDDSLARRPPRVLRSLGTGLRHSPSSVFGAVLAVAGFAALVLLGPIVSVAGILGLLLTPVRHLVRRRRPGALRRWPPVRTLVTAAIPLAAAALWAARWSMVVPANVLAGRPQGRRSMAALRRSAEAAQGRWGTVTVSMIGAVLAGVAAAAGLTWVGYQIDHTGGAVVGEMLGQLLFLGLPVAVATILFRLGEAAGPESPAGSAAGPRDPAAGPYSPTAPYAVDAGPEPPPFLHHPDPAMMTPWRLRHRRTAFFLSFVLACTTTVSVVAVAAVAGPAPQAGAGTSPASITLTVNTGADSTTATVLATEEAACFSGSGTCTFRAAVAEATALAKSGSYGAITVAFVGDTTVDLTAGSPVVYTALSAPGTGTLTIDGTGHEVVLDGQGATQILRVKASWTVVIEGLELQYGRATVTTGQQVTAAGALDLVVPGAQGHVIDDTFDHNTSNRVGAVLTSGPVTVENSTFFTDSATQAGTTPYGDAADLYDGFGDDTLANDSFVTAAGGSVYATSSFGTAVVVDNDYFSSHNGGGFYCDGFHGFGAFRGDDNVVTAHDTSCPGRVTGGTAPFASFGTYGTGVPPTVALLPGSPAIGAAGKTAATTASDACPAEGENGVARPATGCDAGAFQHGTTTTVTVGALGSDTTPVTAVTYGTAFTLQATVALVADPVVPQGTVQFSIDGRKVGTPQHLSPGGTTVADAMATLAVPSGTYGALALTAGTHTVTASFLTSTAGEFATSTSAAPQFVLTVNGTASRVSLQSSADPAAEGTPVTFTMEVTGNSTTAPTGTVSLTDVVGSASTVIATKVALHTGEATFTTHTLPVGPQSLYAVYSGDANNGAGRSPTLSEDVQGPSTLVLVPSTATTVYGATVTLTATVPESGTTAPTGTVVIMAGTTELGDVPLAAGSAQVTTHTLPVGTDTVTATYSGDHYYASVPQATAAATTVTVATAGTTTGLALTVGGTPATQAAYGVPVTLTATATNTGSPLAPTGTVVFTVGGKTVGTVALAPGSPVGGQGTATATYTTQPGDLPVGADQVGATLVPGTGFAASTATATTFTVSSTGTTVTVTSSAPTAKYGQTVTLTATVSASGGSVAVPVGSVTFYDGTIHDTAAVLATVAVTDGTASAAVSALAVGTHQVTAAYVPRAVTGTPVGTGAYQGSTSAAISETVAPAATAVQLAVTPTGGTPYGTSVTVTATVAVAAPGSGTPSGTVAVTSGSATLGAITLSGGKGQLVLSGLTATTYTLQGTYIPSSGDFAASSGTATYTVGADTTKTTFTTTPTSSHYGQTVTMTATVANTNPGSSAMPTGTVTFYDGSTALATVALTTTGPHPGTATWSTAGLSRGTHALYAKYDGTPDFDTSSSPTGTVTLLYQVTAATTATSITVTGTPSADTPVTITVTVAVTDGAGSPTGTVRLSDTTTGQSWVLPLPAGGGQVVVRTVLLSYPGGTLVATFMPTTPAFPDYAPSTDHLAVNVAPGTATVTVSGSATSIDYGQSVTLTATVGGAPAPHQPTGTVTFYAITAATRTQVPLGTAPVALTGANPGTATVTTSAIPVGATAVVATYSGDHEYVTVTSAGLPVTVAPVPTTVTLSAPATYVGQAVVVTVTVASTTGAQPTGTVLIVYGTPPGSGQVVGSGHVSPTHERVAATVTPTAVGSASVKATFHAATGDFVSSTATAPLAAAARPTTFAQFFVGGGTAAVEAPTPATVILYDKLGLLPGPTGEVTIHGATGAQCLAPLAPLSTGFTTEGTCQLTLQAVGTVAVGATYPGDRDSAPATDATAVTVGKQAPSVQFSASPTQWVAGEPVTLSWDVAGPTVADGRVTITSATQSQSIVCTSTSLVGSCTITYPASSQTAPQDMILEYSGDADFNAAFASLQANLAACVVVNAPTISPAGAGTVQFLSTPNCDDGTGYVAGSQVRLQATPTGSYQFQEWAGDGDTSTYDAFVVQGPGPITPWAIFAAPCVTVTIGTYQPTVPTTAGFVASPTDPNCGTGTHQWQTHRSGAQTGSFTAGSTVTVVARPRQLQSGYTAVLYGWTGVPAGQTGTTVHVPVSGTTVVIADLGPACDHGLSVTATGGGTAAVSTPTNCSHGGSGYAEGTKVAVSTTATGTHYFVRWTGPVASTKVGPSSATGTVVVVGDDEHAKAVYGTCVSLSVQNPYGNSQGLLGTVSVSPEGNCPTMGQGWYLPGTTVALSGSYNYQGISFRRWTGDPTVLSTSLHTSMVVNGDTTVTADFYDSFTCRALTVKVIPAGSASVATTYRFGTNGCPPGTYYDRWHGTTGSPVSFTATPASGHPLQGWTSSTHKALQTGGTTVASVTGVQGSTYGGTFLGTSVVTAWTCEGVYPQVTLISPDGTRHTEEAPSTADFVDVSPPPDCPIGSASWTVGTIFAPAANAPAVGYQFQGWSDAATGTTPDAPGIVLDGSTSGITITATYKVICHKLTSDFDTGESVSPAPNCPDTSPTTHEYIGGTTVALAATGHSGDNFTGWTGHPTGTNGNYAWVTMDTDEAVYADYTSKTVGQKISDALEKAGTEIAITAKKVTGVVAAAASAFLIGDNPLTAAGSLTVLLGTGISDLLKEVGVSGSGLTSLNNVLTDISQTIAMTTAFLNCTTVWSANANSTSQSHTTAENQIGKEAATLEFVTQTTASYDEQLAQEEAAQQAAAEQPYNLTGAPEGATANIDTLDTVSKGVKFVSKYGARIGAAATVGVSIYQEVTGGPGVGWDATATSAWTGGGQVYNACLTAAEPTYMKALTQEYTRPTTG